MPRPSLRGVAVSMRPRNEGPDNRSSRDDHRDLNPEATRFHLRPFHVSVLRLPAGGRAPEGRVDPFLCYRPVGGIKHLDLIRRVTAGCDDEKAGEGNNDSAHRRQSAVV